MVPVVGMLIMIKVDKVDKADGKLSVSFCPAAGRHDHDQQF